MSKKRDLMDYAQLGLSAAQAYKLSGIASELGRLREASDNQQKKAHKLAQMRAAIVTAEEFLARLESDTTGAETPFLKQFVFTHDVERSLKLAGVLPPLGFESWDDLDRIKKLEKRLDTFRDKLHKSMTDEQRQEAERCVTYMAEEKDLADLIMVSSSAEALARNKKRLAELEAELKIKREGSLSVQIVRGSEKWGCMLSAISLALFFIIAFLLPSGDFTKALVPILGALALIGFALYLGQFFLRAVTGEKVIPADIRKLEEQAGELEERIEEFGDEEGEGLSVATTAILARDNFDVDAARKRFGGVASAEALRAMYIERRDFVRGIIGPQYLARPERQAGE